MPITLWSAKGNVESTAGFHCKEEVLLEVERVLKFFRCQNQLERAKRLQTCFDALKSLLANVHTIYFTLSLIFFTAERQLLALPRFKTSSPPLQF
jgi:hypothetical protein